MALEVWHYVIIPIGGILVVAIVIGVFIYCKRNRKDIPSVSCYSNKSGDLSSPPCQIPGSHQTRDVTDTVLRYTKDPINNKARDPNIESVYTIEDDDIAIPLDPGPAQWPPAPPPPDILD